MTSTPVVVEERTSTGATELLVMVLVTTAVSTTVEEAMLEAPVAVADWPWLEQVASLFCESVRNVDVKGLCA